MISIKTILFLVIGSVLTDQTIQNEFLLEYLIALLG